MISDKVEDVSTLLKDGANSALLVTVEDSLLIEMEVVEEVSKVEGDKTEIGAGTKATLLDWETEIEDSEIEVAEVVGSIWDWATGILQRH
jgi:hypothetical protein